MHVSASKVCYFQPDFGSPGHLLLLTVYCHAVYKFYHLAVSLSDLSLFFHFIIISSYNSRWSREIQLITSTSLYLLLRSFHLFPDRSASVNTDLHQVFRGLPLLQTPPDSSSLASLPLYYLGICGEYGKSILICATLFPFPKLEFCFVLFVRPLFENFLGHLMLGIRLG